MTSKRCTSHRWKIVTLALGSFNALVVTMLLFVCTKLSLPTYLILIMEVLLWLQIFISFVFFFYPLGSMLIPPKHENQDAK